MLDPPRAESGEEMLRFCGPAQWFMRAVHKPTEVAGVSMRPGQRVQLLIQSGNRDPRESGEDGGFRSFLSLASWRGFIRRPGLRFAACLARSSADSSRNLAAPAEPEVRSRN